MERPSSRYAVPLSVLVAGAHVEVQEQVEGHAAVPPPPWYGGGVPYGEGHDVDGDGD